MGSATVMPSMVVIPISTFRTCPVGGWHGTLALALVEDTVCIFSVFFGQGRLAHASLSDNIRLTMAQTFLSD